MIDSRFAPLTDAEFHRAVLMWSAGNDTLAIATAFQKHESTVANLIDSIKTAAAYVSAEAAE